MAMSAVVIAAAPGRATRPEGRLARWRGHLLLGALSALSVLLLYWMIVTALRPEIEIFSAIPWPQHPSLSNVTRLVAEIPFAGMIANTFIVSIAVTGLQLLTGLFAGYVMARWRGRASRILLGLLTVTWLIPPQVIMVPNYVLVSRLGLLDTLWALIVPQMAAAFPIMLLYQSFRAVPQEMIEAAVIDGACHWTIRWRVIVPNLRAALASVGILIFIATWNDYFWPLLVTRSPDSAVIQIGLQMFFTSEGTQWGPLMAAATLASLPIIAIYALLRRQIVDTFVRPGLR
jgi:ABC-type glycerol-3-phosphate transport system permease component